MIDRRFLIRPHREHTSDSNGFVALLYIEKRALESNDSDFANSPSVHHNLVISVL